MHSVFCKELHFSFLMQKEMKLMLKQTVSKQSVHIWTSFNNRGGGLEESSFLQPDSLGGSHFLGLVIHAAEFPLGSLHVHKSKDGNRLGWQSAVMKKQKKKKLKVFLDPDELFGYTWRFAAFQLWSVSYDVIKIYFFVTAHYTVCIICFLNESLKWGLYPRISRQWSHCHDQITGSGRHWRGGASGIYLFASDVRSGRR